MDRAIIFFSYTGNCRKFARRLQSESGAKLIEVEEKEPRTKVNAYLKGTREAIAFRKVRLSKPLPDLSPFDSITLVFPVWAGHPAPAFNSVVAAIHPGTKVQLYLVSSGGSTPEGVKQKIRGRLAAQRLEVVKISDISSKTAGRQNDKKSEDD